MKSIKSITPPFHGYKDYPVNDEGKILLDRADDGKIVIKRKNVIAFGNGLLALCDGSKVSEADWQDLRRGFYLEETDGHKVFRYCLGGSDAGAVLGVSPYSTALDIYNAKKHTEDQEISNDTDYLFKYGHYIEPLIAQGFAALTKLEVFKNDCVFFNEATGFMQANVDYFVREKNGGVSILEIKTTSPNSTTEQLAKNGQVPPTYYAQAVLHYPLVLSAAFNVVGTYFAVGSDNILSNIKICHFNRDLEGEKKLMSCEQSFVNRLINDDPPKDTSSPEKRIEKRGLKQTEAKPAAVDLNDSAKAATAEFAALSAEEKRINEQLKPIKKRKDELQAIICEQLGDAAMSTPFVVDGKSFVVKWDSYVRETVDKTVLKHKYPEAFAETVKSSISRKFALSNKEVKA